MLILLLPYRIPNALSNRDTCYFISENDAILNARRVARYLRDHGVKKVEDGGNLHFMEGVAHGACAFNTIPFFHRGIFL